jgi:hypothetical protein
MGRGQTPDHEIWVIAFPEVQSLIEPHLDGLPSMQNQISALPLAEPKTNPAAVIGVSLLLLCAFVAGLALIAEKWDGYLVPRRAASRSCPPATATEGS